MGGHQDLCVFRELGDEGEGPILPSAVAMSDLLFADWIAQLRRGARLPTLRSCVRSRLVVGGDVCASGGRCRRALANVV